MYWSRLLESSGPWLCFVPVPDPERLGPTSDATTSTTANAAAALLDAAEVVAWAREAVGALVEGASDHDRVRVSAVRALGHLLRADLPRGGDVLEGEEQWAEWLLEGASGSPDMLVNQLATTRTMLFDGTSLF